MDSHKNARLTPKGREEMIRNQVGRNLWSDRFPASQKHRLQNEIAAECGYAAALDFGELGNVPPVAAVQVRHHGLGHAAIHAAKLKAQCDR